MKFRRVFGGIVLGLGCAVTFVGAMGCILPSIQNRQLQLFLASFSRSDAGWFAGILSFAMNNGAEVAALGLVLLLIGLLVTLRSTSAAPSEQEPQAPQAPHELPAVPEVQPPVREEAPEEFIPDAPPRIAYESLLERNQTLPQMRTYSWDDEEEVPQPKPEKPLRQYTPNE